jgi:hypothetical protein
MLYGTKYISTTRTETGLLLQAVLPKYMICTKNDAILSHMQLYKTLK